MVNLPQVKWNLKSSISGNQERKSESQNWVKTQAGVHILHYKDYLRRLDPLGPFTADIGRNESINLGFWVDF